MNFRSILKRALSGVIYIGVVVGCIIAGPVGVLCLALAFGILATIEFSKISSGMSLKDTVPLIMFDCLGVISVILTLATMTCPLFFPLWAICLALLLVRLTVQLYRKDADPMRTVALSVMKYVYIGVPLGCMTALSFIQGLQYFLLAIFLLIWINDTGAFLVGCTLGRHRLFERLSPKKSWEGFFGGLGLTVLAACLFSRAGNFFGMGDCPWLWAGLGVTVTAAATWGDLFESMIKRSLQIKDSGHIMPGHGGILDRIDSLLFVMPAAAIYIYLFLVG